MYSIFWVASYMLGYIYFLTKNAPKNFWCSFWCLSLFQVVVSDHGMTEGGNHGGSSYEETDSLALFIGHSVESPYCSPYDQNEALQVKCKLYKWSTFMLLIEVLYTFSSSLDVCVAQFLHILWAKKSLLLYDIFQSLGFMLSPFKLNR